MIIGIHYIISSFIINIIIMEKLDNMFNKLAIAYSKMDTSIKEINNNYLYARQYHDNDIKTLHIIYL